MSKFVNKLVKNYNIFFGFLQLRIRTLGLHGSGERIHNNLDENKKNKICFETFMQG